MVSATPAAEVTTVPRKIEATVTAKELKKDRLDQFQGTLKPVWCPGCGDFGALSSLRKSLAMTGLEPHEVLIVSGIGCSGRLAAYVGTYGFHTIHGRALPVSLGAKLANPDLAVIAVSGDGDAFSIGGGHLPHMCRRNPDVTLIILDNEIYGLTKGQTSPTSPEEHKTGTTPFGSAEVPLNPIAMLLSYRTSYVARAYTGQPKEMTAIISEALAHPGFSVVQVMSPCTTFYNTYKMWQTMVKPLPDEHDPADLYSGMKYALDEETMYVGVFHSHKRPTLGAHNRKLHEKLGGEKISNTVIEGIFDSYK